jgi:hypothetical protein
MRTRKTQAAERGHRALQPLYSRRDRPPRISEQREALCGGWSHDGSDRRGADAELRRERSNCQERRSNQASCGPCHPRKGMAASRLSRSALQRRRGTRPMLPVFSSCTNLDSTTIEDIAQRHRLRNLRTTHCLVGRLSGRRRQGWRAVRQGRWREEDGRFRGRRALANPRADCTSRSGHGFCSAAASPTPGRAARGRLAAAAPFCGGAPPPPIPKIKAAILVHHGQLDTRLAEAWPGVRHGLESGRRAFERPHPIERRAVQQRRDAGRYSKAAADQAWQRTIDWFNKYVRGNRATRCPGSRLTGSRGENRT